VHHALLTYILPAVVILLGGYLLWHRRSADEVRK
jgi:hypothetical protein